MIKIETRLSMVARAALIWGRHEQFLRICLQQGKVPFGFAIKKEGSSHHDYHIEDRLLREYIGEEAWIEGLKRVEAHLAPKEKRSDLAESTSA